MLIKIISEQLLIKVKCKVNTKGYKNNFSRKQMKVVLTFDLKKDDLDYKESI